MKLIVNREVVPVAYVTKGKQRIKQLNDTVYLNNGDQFEIELFNPTSNKVLAQIELNGKSLGSGIVLRPGERVYLERFLDTSRKFLFETYTIDGGNQDALDAINKNGTVDVKFYMEVVQHYYGNCCGTVTWTNPFPYGSITCGTSTLTSAPSTSYTSSFSNSEVKPFNGDRTRSSGKKLKSSGVPLQSNFLSMAKIDIVETGRVEKGGISSQVFGYDNSNFNSWYSWRSTWKILPLSQKPTTREDLKVYCGGCGAKRKKDSHKFCPNCGTEY